MTNIHAPTTCLPEGFYAAGVAAQIKKNGQPDVALVASDRDCSAAALFTTNKVKAAPILHDQAVLATNATRIRAVVINSGCANACTGEQGLTDCRETAQSVARSLSSSPIGAGEIDASQVLVMSTGVIGVNLPMGKLKSGVKSAVLALTTDGLEAAARAIMTTDTVQKIACAEVSADGKTYSVTGIAKGSGMIHPNMATMLSVVMTDAAIDAASLKTALIRAGNVSFNHISVDGDTSTNDTLLLIANGASGVSVDTPEKTAEFHSALTEVCISLAKQMARDGEGATKLITLSITGAQDMRTAENVGRTIAKSPLVKTAFYGEDANWGRIIAAAGYSGEDVDPDRMTLWFGPVLVFEHGMPTQYSEKEATRAIQMHDVEVRLDLGAGSTATTIWTCDLSHDYVTINGKYRT
jgi:glutamate N-acetyltransferase/amino-acid N-acetyltransferase